MLKLSSKLTFVVFPYHPCSSQNFLRRKDNFESTSTTFCTGWPMGYDILTQPEIVKIMFGVHFRSWHTIPLSFLAFEQ